MNKQNIKQIRKDIKFIKEESKGKDLNKVYFGSVTAKYYLKKLKEELKKEVLKNE